MPVGHAPKRVVATAAVIAKISNVMKCRVIALMPHIRLPMAGNSSLRESLGFRDPSQPNQDATGPENPGGSQKLPPGHIAEAMNYMP